MLLILWQMAYFEFYRSVSNFGDIDKEYINKLSLSQMHGSRQRPNFVIVAKTKVLTAQRLTAATFAAIKARQVRLQI